MPGKFGLQFPWVPPNMCKNFRYNHSIRILEQNLYKPKSTPVATTTRQELLCRKGPISPNAKKNTLPYKFCELISEQVKKQQKQKNKKKTLLVPNNYAFKDLFL